MEGCQWCYLLTPGQEVLTPQVPPAFKRVPWVPKQRLTQFLIQILGLISQRSGRWQVPTQMPGISSAEVLHHVGRKGTPT